MFCQLIYIFRKYQQDVCKTGMDEKPEKLPTEGNKDNGGVISSI